MYLGINVNAGTGFLTASHCTSAQGPDPFISPTEVFQPVFSMTNHIATEAEDPPWFGPEENWCCISMPNKCTFSDVARMVYDGDKAPGVAGQAKVHRTAFAGTGWGTQGSKDIVGTVQILEDFWNPIPGDRLDKIGAATGWTYNLVEDECEDTTTLSGNYLMCQIHLTEMMGTVGDSGAPLIWFANIDQAYFAGIVSAGNAWEIYASRIDRIRDALRPFTIIGL